MYQENRFRLSLMELMIIIVIIGILAIVAMGERQKYQQREKDTNPSSLGLVLSSQDQT